MLPGGGRQKQETAARWNERGKEAGETKVAGQILKIRKVKTRKDGTMKKRKVYLLALVAVLLIGLLGGCSKGGDGKKEPSGTVPKGENAADTDSTAKGKEEGSSSVGGNASGAYVEEEIALPEEVANGEYAVNDFLSLPGNSNSMAPEGGIVLYATKQEDYEEGMPTDARQELKRYILQADGTWKEEREAWMDEMDWAGRVVGGFSYDPDGNLYLTVMRLKNGSWTGATNEFYRVKAEDGKLEQLNLKGGGEDGIYIANLYVNGEGKVLQQPSAYPTNVTVSDLETGKYLFEFLPENGTPIWYGDQILSTGEGGANLVFLDGKTGEQVNSITVHEKSEQGVDGEYTYGFSEVKIYAEPGKGIWLAGEDGLTYLAEGGSKWEVLLDPGLSVLGMPSYYATGLMRHPDGDFYLSYLDSTTYQYGLVRISYQEGVSNEQDTTLTIYSLSESDSVRQAVVEFQRQHRNVKVEYRAMMSENSSATTEDCIKTLNTELLAGKGPDLLVTDGLPFDSYVEKGVLADLSELSDALVSDGLLMENIAEAIKGEQGAYRIPTRMNVPIWIGTQKALQATGSIKELAAASAQATVPYFGIENYDYQQLFQCLYYLYGGELTKGEISREKVTGFLTDYLTLAKQSGIDDGENSYASLSAINTLCGNNGELGYFDIPSMSSLMLPEKVMRDSGLGYLRAGEGFLPVVSLAVNQASGQKELAGEFIRELLGESIQDADLDGIPVNPASLEKKPENRQENVMIGTHFVKTLPDGSKEESSITAECPEKEEIEEFVIGLKNLNQVLSVDETVRQMIEAELPALWRGEKDVETVSESVFQKLQTYLAE